jgi:hypothetical protein
MTSTRSVKSTKSTKPANMPPMKTTMPKPGTLSSMSAAPAKVGPNPFSILVFLEGPWLITHKGGGPASEDRITAYGLGDMHRCELGFWNSQAQLDQKAPIPMINPLDPSMEALFLLPNGQIDVRIDHPRTPPTSFIDLFDVPCHERMQPFVYIRDNQYTVTPLDGDRTITLDMPDHIWVGGQLVQSVVNDPGSVCDMTAGAPNLHVGVILEYQPSQGARRLLANSNGGTSFEVLPAQHLIARLVPVVMDPPLSEREHIALAFKKTFSRLNLPAGQELTVSLPPGQRPLSVQAGNYVGNINDRELGTVELHDRGNKYVGNPESCNGSGGVVGHPHPPA